MILCFQLIVLAAFVAVAQGGVIGAPAAVVGAPVAVARYSDATIDPNPAYSFAYDVQDAITGDSKSHVESRANGIVKGQYTVADPDGTRRIVDYYADPIHGFNAVVRRAPLAVAAPVVAARAVAPAPVVAARAVAPAPAFAPAPVVAPAPFAARAFAPSVAAPAFARAAVAPAVAPVARLASPYVAAGPGVGLSYFATPGSVNPGLFSQYAVAPFQG